MLIDTHCHLNFKEFKEDADEVIKRSLDSGVQIINVGAEWRTSQRAVKYAGKYSDGVWAVVGLHPIHLFANTESGVENAEKFDYQRYLELAKNDKVVAIGEVGLDYHHFNIPTNLQISYKSTNNKNKKNSGNETNNKKEGFIIKKYKKEIRKIRQDQMAVLREFVKMANEVNKPLVLHCWGIEKKDKDFVKGANAYEDLLEIVSAKHDVKTVNKERGVVHSFIGSYRMAEKFIEAGFKIGLNGIITYSESYDKLIRKIGVENIIVETDAPYLTPMPLDRYSRNEPINVKLVAQKIAEVLEIDINEVKKQTTKNARKLFHL